MIVPLARRPNKRTPSEAISIYLPFKLISGYYRLAGRVIRSQS